MSDPVSIRVTLDQSLPLIPFDLECDLERKKWEPFLLKALEQTPYVSFLPIELNLFITHDKGIQPYNLTYRKKDRPTNVLSFPMKEKQAPWQKPLQGPFILGDILLNWQAIEREAPEQNCTPGVHFLHLLVHGFLHLLHYDHVEENEAKEMESIETQVFLDHGLSDPYTLTHPL